MNKENLSREERMIADIQRLRPIDDVFFEVLATESGVCEEILRVIMEDDLLVVNDIIPQSSQRNIYGRSVRLDALCTLSDGRKVNIEVQRADDDDHLRRARYNASSITVKSTDTGKRFEEVLELYIVYISERDFVGDGRTIYHMEKIWQEIGKPVDDGLHEIFVNASVDDGTDIAELMKCFLEEKVSNTKFPKISEAVYRLKETEGGVKAVCSIMEQYVKESLEEGIGIGREEGIGIGREEGISGSVTMLRGLSIPDEKIVGMIMQQYNLSLDEAVGYVKKTT